MARRGAGEEGGCEGEGEGEGEAKAIRRDCLRNGRRGH